MKYKKLPLSFFVRDSEIVAQELIWKIIKKWDFVWIINETEAYKWDWDWASHASKWITPRNAPMFEIWGFSYVYLIYWMYNCFNITTWKEGEAGAVLIRSVIPIEWIEKMISLRKIKDEKNLTNWPWKFCKAFDITKIHNHKNLLEKDSPIEILDSNIKLKWKIITTPRIWIKEWLDKMWRFVFIKD